jgi:hypothetical protein
MEYNRGRKVTRSERIAHIHLLFSTGDTGIHRSIEKMYIL